MTSSPVDPWYGYEEEGFEGLLNGTASASVPTRDGEK